MRNKEIFLKGATQRNKENQHNNIINYMNSGSVIVTDKW